MTFGGGASLCPGRNFAKNEIKVFLIEMLSNYDMEIIEKDKLLKLDEKRYQFGTISPLNDVKFKFKLKSSK